MNRIELVCNGYFESPEIRMLVPTMNGVGEMITARHHPIWKDGMYRYHGVYDFEGIPIGWGIAHEMRLGGDLTSIRRSPEDDNIHVISYEKFDKHHVPGSIVILLFNIHHARTCLNASGLANISRHHRDFIKKYNASILLNYGLEVVEQIDITHMSGMARLILDKTRIIVLGVSSRLRRVIDTISWRDGMIFPVEAADRVIEHRRPKLDGDDMPIECIVLPPEQQSTADDQRLFTCLNRTPRSARVAGVSFLKLKGLLNDGYVSLTEHGIGQLSVDQIAIESSGLVMDNIITTPIFLPDDTEISLEREQPNTRYYTESLFSIVFETHLNWVDFAFTEKTFKPMLYGQPVVIPGMAPEMIERYESIGIDFCKEWFGPVYASYRKGSVEEFFKGLQVLSTFLYRLKGDVGLRREFIADTYPRMKIVQQTLYDLDYVGAILRPILDEENLPKSKI